MDPYTQRMTDRLINQKKQGLYRHPPTVVARTGRLIQVGQRQLLNFASNDYLGLGASTQLAQRVAQNFDKYGASASSSRLVSGYYSAIEEAEAALAEYCGYNSALIYPSGYQCNLGVIATLFEKGDTVFGDKHIHASSVAAIKLSGARFYGYNHNCMDHLKRRLTTTASSWAAILTESLFSMDGDLLNIEELASIKIDHDLLVLVDEAHALGVMGENGRGLSRPVADLAVGTLGKAFGLFGAFALLTTTFREYLINFSAPLIYTTSLPEAHGASILAALDMVIAANDRRQRLAEVTTALHTRLCESGFDVGGDAHIISVKVGSELKATAMCQHLFEKGLFVFSARFPTVPLNQAILRISMTAMHTHDDVNALVTGLMEARDALAH